MTTKERDGVTVKPTGCHFEPSEKSLFLLDAIAATSRVSSGPDSLDGYYALA
jgi:hypothetical protein